MLPWTYGNLTDAQFKTKLDQDRARLTAAKQEMVAASRKLDPALDVAGAIDVSASPVYAVQTFENEAAFETFKKDLMMIPSRRLFWKCAVRLCSPVPVQTPNTRFNRIQNLRFSTRV
ncbi:hypothetical protein Q0F98_21660 [Paenibacillus amylolyticus]|nr:hypothetical protein Q0F98_21660 [Paenibacillus amylolyticus]